MTKYELAKRAQIAKNEATDAWMDARKAAVAELIERVRDAHDSLAALREMFLELGETTLSNLTEAARVQTSKALSFHG